MTRMKKAPVQRATGHLKTKTKTMTRLRPTWTPSCATESQRTTTTRTRTKRRRTPRLRVPRRLRMGSLSARRTNCIVPTASCSSRLWLSLIQESAGTVGARFPDGQVMRGWV